MFVLRKTMEKEIRSHINQEAVLSCELEKERMKKFDVQQELNKNKEKLRTVENDLSEANAKVAALQEEITKLVKMLNAKECGHKEGPWCDGCKNKLVSRASYTFKKKEPSSLCSTTQIETLGFGTTGEYTICKKRIKELCEDFEDQLFNPFGFGCAPV